MSILPAIDFLEDVIKKQSNTRVSENKLNILHKYKESTTTKELVDSLRHRSANKKYYDSHKDKILQHKVIIKENKKTLAKELELLFNSLPETSFKAGIYKFTVKNNPYKIRCHISKNKNE